MSDTAQQSDTMAIAKDGSFVKDIQLLEPGIAYFGLEDKKAFCQVFLEDGIKFNVNITENKRSNKKGKGNETKEMEKATFEYEGDDKDCYEYLKTHDMLNLFDAGLSIVWTPPASVVIGSYGQQMSKHTR